MSDRGKILVKGRRIRKNAQEMLGRLSPAWQAILDKECAAVKLGWMVTAGWVERKRLGDYWMLRLTQEGLAARDTMERLLAKRASEARWGNDSRDRKTSE